MDGCTLTARYLQFIYRYKSNVLEYTVHVISQNGGATEADGGASPVGPSVATPLI